MPDSVEERRLQVKDLLIKCCDAKLLQGGTDRATKHAEDAFRYATFPAPLPSPWPEIASYRLAHLLLRGRERRSQLATIDEHLRRAAGCGADGPSEPLGSLPHVYRLAVMHLMMSEEKNSSQRESLKLRISEVFRRACDTIHQPSVLNNQPRNVIGPIQHEVFNLLEFASYLLNQPYDPLAGHGGRDELAGVFDGAWNLVGPDSEISAVRMSKEFAYAELDSRGTACPDALLIRLPEQGVEPSWRLVTEHAWAEVTADWIRLLANLLNQPSIDSDALRRQVVGNDDSFEARARYRQVKSRLLKELRQLTGRPDLVLFRGNSLARDELPIYGAVYRKSLRFPPAV